MPFLMTFSQPCYEVDKSCKTADAVCIYVCITSLVVSYSILQFHCNLNEANIGYQTLLLYKLIIHCTRMKGASALLLRCNLLNLSIHLSLNSPTQAHTIFSHASISLVLTLLTGRYLSKDDLEPQNTASALILNHISTVKILLFLIKLLIWPNFTINVTCRMGFVSNSLSCSNNNKTHVIIWLYMCYVSTQTA